MASTWSIHWTTPERMLLRAHYSSPCGLPLSGGHVGVNPLPSVFILLSYSDATQLSSANVGSLPQQLLRPLSKQYHCTAFFLPCTKLKAVRLILTYIAQRACHLQRLRKKLVWTQSHNKAQLLFPNWEHTNRYVPIPQKPQAAQQTQKLCWYSPSRPHCFF